MPDFRTYIRQHLSSFGLPGAQEAAIIEEIALDFEARYERALWEGADEKEAWSGIVGEVDWTRLASDLRRTISSSRTNTAKASRSSPIFTCLRDLRYAGRLLRMSPGFTVVAVLTLALCLGANLTIFAAMDSILLRPLPFTKPDQLVTIFHTYPKVGIPHSDASVPNYYDYRRSIKAFASTAMISRNTEQVVVGLAGSPFRVGRDRVSAEFFRTLGVPLLMGRSFTEEEMDYSRSAVVILSYGFWQSYFQRDPRVLGRKFQMDGSPVTVVGVLPRNFQYLSRHTQFYVPRASDARERAVDQRNNNEVQVIARLSPHATLAMARAQVAAFRAAQLKDDPYAAALRAAAASTVVSGLHEDHVRSIRPILVLLQVGVLLLLFIGVVNLVNLLLIRASGRAKELAIRQSLGASRAHVLSEVISETLLLSLTGGVFGLGIGAAGVRLLETLGVNQLPLGSYIAFDWRTALVGLGAAVVLGLLIALPVGWFNLRGHLANAIHSESRGGTASRAAQRLRYAFIVAQIALAFVLLTGAGLLGVSLHQVLETSPGFQTEHVLTGQLTLPAKKYPDGKTQLPLVRRLIAAIQAQPGVRSVAVGDLMPFGTENSSGSTTVEGVETKDGLRNVHYRNGIDGQYWQTMGIPLIEGRLLEDADNDRKQLVCVVDQAFARRYWPGESALGHRLSDGPVFQKDQAFTIVGVVGSVKQNELDDVKPLGTIYYPYRYWWGLEISVLAKTAVATESIAPALRKAVLEIDPDLPIEKLEPMRNLIDDSLVNRRSPAVLAGIFAVVALLLTAMGTYGVLAYAIRQRRREIGLRMALGARPQQVLRQFLGLGTKMLAAGMAVGMAGAWAVSRSMQSVLFGIGSVQLNIFAVTAGVMISVVLSAILLPSLWASRVSPTEALRD